MFGWWWPRWKLTFFWSLNCLVLCQVWLTRANVWIWPHLSGRGLVCNAIKSSTCWWMAKFAYYYVTGFKIYSTYSCNSFYLILSFLLRNTLIQCVDRLIKDFDREVKDMESSNDAGTNRMLNERKQSMVWYQYEYQFSWKTLCITISYWIYAFWLQVKELNRYVALKKQ